MGQSVVIVQAVERGAHVHVVWYGRQDAVQEAAGREACIELAMLLIHPARPPVTWSRMHARCFTAHRPAKQWPMARFVPRECTVGKNVDAPPLYVHILLST
jgi:hypothetical protein